MLLFPLSYFPADIPLIVFNRPTKTTRQNFEFWSNELTKFSLSVVVTAQY